MNEIITQTIEGLLFLVVIAAALIFIINIISIIGFIFYTYPYSILWFIGIGIMSYCAGKLLNEYK